ncbi:carbohydrate ABC transporter permease [Candidatus Bipolaricaulota bacterium]|nr:carbohydrate ABC transporter permease [Candidatus Bipolaricaulota bacterium]
MNFDQLSAPVRIGIYLVLLALSLFYLLPIYSLINTSLKSEQELASSPVSPVQNPTFAAYKQAFGKINQSFLNSVIMALSATALSAIFGCMSGYIFSKYKFKGSNVLFFLIIIGFYIAPQSILIPLVRFIGSLGLYNTLFGLILTHTAYGIPITTLLFYNYIDPIPHSLIEIAQIDGASVFNIFTRIILPLSLPGFAVVGIFQFTNIWNEFLFGLTLTSGKASQPVTVAVANLKGTTVAAWNVHMAGAFISIVPVLLIYIFFLRLVIKGLLLGSVKE